MSVSRRMALGVARGVIGRSMVAALTPFASKHRLTVVTYHRIASTSEATEAMAPGLASATQADLEQQLQDLSRRFHVIGADDLVSLREGTPHRSSKPLAVVTFDDGYRDFADLAWPILRGVGVPAILFVATAMPDGGTPFWWDRLWFSLRTTGARELRWREQRFPLTTDAERRAAYGAVHDELQLSRTDETVRRVADLAVELETDEGPADLLGWHELRGLDRDGLAIGAHSHAHHRLDRLRPDELTHDLATCRGILTDQLGATPRVFSYPTGYYDLRVAAAVAEVGFEVGFTTDRGVTDLRRPAWMTMPRINVGLNTNAILLSLQALVLPAARAAQGPDLTRLAPTDDTPPADMEEMPDAPD